MFGEDESESPRVPSPWDSLMSSPASSSPYSKPVLSSSPLATTYIPRLVPENDDGNVEYKLQLLNPSSSRFARLVTQMKWRLLEGGGQAYYELGVADSGALVGLTRNDLERSLETLEMMAGEIGASVIIVKEIEVPGAMAELAAAQEDHRNRRVRRGRESDDGTTTTAFETETEVSTTDIDKDGDEDFSAYVGVKSLTTFQDSPVSSVAIFTMDPEPDPGDSADVETDHDGPQFSIDLEISSVFKPRPMRTRMQSHYLSTDSKRNFKGPKPKKLKHQALSNASDEQKPQQFGKTHSRRQARDRRREEKQKVLVAVASNSLTTTNPDTSVEPAGLMEDTESLVSGLGSLHVTLDEPEPVALATEDAIPAISLSAESEDKAQHITDIDEVDDVFASPKPLTPYTTFQSSSNDHVTPLSEGTDGMLTASIASCGRGKDARLIVEALVVRKMSLEEAFLDFSGFAT